LRPDAVVLDVTMDVLNGYHACRLLRQEPATREMPILLLTAREGTSARFWGMRAGADACLLKEDGLERLAPAIAHAIAARSKHTPGAPQPAGAGVSDGDLLSRVAALLDRELFRATMLNEVSALARHMDDLPATLEHLGIVLRRVVGVDVSFAALVYDAPPGVYALFRADDAPESIWQMVWSATDRPGWQIPGWDQRALMTPRVSEPVSLVGLEARRIEAAPHWEFIYFQAAGTRPSDDTLELCALFARAATLVVSNARLHAEVQRFALTDDLTGVYNRRYVQGRLEVELERSARSGDSVGLILLDLDEFKSVNDRFGHLVGDAALRDTAQALSRILRPYDLMGRFGGEEFPGKRSPPCTSRARRRPSVPASVLRSLEMVSRTSIPC
jgi:two-component system cell cycle response regulator